MVVSTQCDAMMSAHIFFDRLIASMSGLTLNAQKVSYGCNLDGSSADADFRVQILSGNGCLNEPCLLFLQEQAFLLGQVETTIHLQADD